MRPAFLAVQNKKPVTWGLSHLNLASILIKKVLQDSDVETWGAFYCHYLPQEYHKLHETIQKHVDIYGELPSFKSLKLSVRDARLLEQLYSVEVSEEVDIACSQLLDYLKNEFTQIESMNMIENFLENSISMSTAEEIIEAIQDIVLQLEDKVDVLPPEESMRKISLFESEERLGNKTSLGLNREYDEFVQYDPGDMIMFGGKRGNGKSVICTNLASLAYENKRSSIYFTIEMSSRQILQRMCAISTGVPINAIKYRNMSISQWETVASWWSRRFEDGSGEFKNYLKHRDFDQFHNKLTQNSLKDPQLDVVHDPSLSISKIRTELDKKMKILKPNIVIVDYINQVERSGRHARLGQYDWTEQIEVSKALKNMAQTYDVLFVTAFQIDASGEARFAKGILDAPDAAFTLNKHEEKDGIMEFTCTKMRNGPETGFISQVDWDTLKIGPNNGILPGEEEGTGEAVGDI